MTELVRQCNDRLTQHRAVLNALSDAGLKIGDRIKTITARTAVTCKSGWNAAAYGLSEYELAWGCDGRLVWKYLGGTGKYTTIPKDWFGLPWGRPNVARLTYWATGLERGDS